MPLPFAHLTRTQLDARIAVLRAAVDALWAQSDRDRGGIYTCIGAMKRHLIDLEEDRRTRDRGVLALVIAPPPGVRA